MTTPNPFSLEPLNTVGDMGTDVAREEPVLYSRRAIDVFSVILCPLFGAVMMGMNFKRLDRPRLMISVICFGFIYTVFSYYMVNTVTERFPVQLWNAVGVLVLHYGFWKYYIGEELQFKKRPIWKPLIICIVLSAILIWAILQNPGGASQ
jgi:tryptophan-rich sensory protein